MSGVDPSDPVVLHKYENGKTLCGGTWYTTGDSPCEVAEANHVDSLKRLPPCEQVDLDAAARLLGIPKFSRCWTRDRASWDDPALKPDSVQAMAMLMSTMQQLNVGLISTATARERAGL